MIGYEGVAKSAVRRVAINKSLDVGYCKVTRVHTSHTSEKRLNNEDSRGAGFVIQLESRESFYFGGSTGLFSIMEGVENQYRPTTLVFQISEQGGVLNAEEAAFACTFYFKTTSLLMPIWQDDSLEE